jgi:hypothetical protein
MNTREKLGVYGVVLAAIFAGSFGAGRVIDPIGLSNAEPVSHAAAMSAGSDLPGLAAAVDGRALVPATDTATAAQPTRYSFTINGEDGVVTEFDIEHTKAMHLIVVRRDFVGFVHDHPTMAPDGTWSTTLTLNHPGAYRVFADFVVDGEKTTLGADLFVAGDFEPTPLPAPLETSDVDGGYQVELAGEALAGKESTLEFNVRRDGTLVTDIPDYLGAKGHLVALRDGDLAYLHVHADEDRLRFEAEFPTAGSYRLFLQFDHGGQIRTAQFTIHAQEATR